MISRLLLVFIFLSSPFLYAQKTSSETIVVGVKDTPPFIIAQADGSYTGISIQLWENIAAELDLDYQYKSYDLEGLQQALQNEEVDVSINPLTVTSDRVAAYDFTQPFFITNLAIATTKSGQNKWVSFVRNFFSMEFLTVILLLLIVLMVFGVLVWLFERNNNPEQFGKGWNGIWSGLWWSAVTMTTVGYGDKAPTTTGGRVVALIWMFTAIIIISGFTASIASALTVSTLEISIKTPKDLQNFNVASVRASTGQAYLKKSNINHEPVATLEDALELLKNGDVDAVVYDEPLLRYTLQKEQYSEQLMILEPTFATQYYSFALPDKSNLLDRINPVLLQEINSPQWQLILRQYQLDK